MTLLTLGRLVMTTGAQEKVGQPVMLSAVSRHRRGDWGDVSAEDKKANDDAVWKGLRVLSSYTDPVTLTKFWVITEADRSTTTVLLPEEY